MADIARHLDGLAIGMSTRSVKRHIITEAATEIERLRQQNRILLAALNEVLELSDAYCCPSTGCGLDRAADIADSAIENVNRTGTEQGGTIRKSVSETPKS